MEVLVNLNNETGTDLYSVEPKDDIGNWLWSFVTYDEAMDYIRQKKHTISEGFLRDTRSTWQC